MREADAAEADRPVARGGGGGCRWTSGGPVCAYIADEQTRGFISFKPVLLGVMEECM